MRTTSGVNLQNFVSIFFPGVSYDIRKEKTKLPHQFHSLFQFLQLFHFTILLGYLYRDNKNRTELFV